MADIVIITQPYSVFPSEVQGSIHTISFSNIKLKQQPNKAERQSLA